MFQIPLTKGEFSLVSPEDYAFLSQFRWCYAPGNGYAVHYYVDDLGKNKTLFMHRAIYQRILGAPIPRGLQIDHINRERLDNRRENLRLATRSQNQANKGIQVNNTSRYKGVSHNHGKWEARIQYENRRINLGRYHDPCAAARMYDAASRLLYQDFAGCNFPDQATPSDVEIYLLSVLEKRGLDVRQLVLGVPA
jgi:hypothetical protein